MKKISIYLVILMIGAACKEKYDLPYSGPATGYLVVDGHINSGQGSTTIRLSRTLALVDSIAFRNETGAAVWVEGDNNTQFPLFEGREGLYFANQLNLQANAAYRLRIQTSDGKRYFSEFVANKKTPDIDDITWEREQDGVVLYANAHDDQNNTWYYKWDYTETWEFHSAFNSMLMYRHDVRGNPVGVVDRPGDQALKMYYCWQSMSSTNILIGSSKKLSRDTIHLPIHFIEQGSWKISVLYSVLLRQYALSQAGYDFLARMKKNTEQVGSLFDAQPSELKGNITCQDDAAEIVIGFVDVSPAKEKRVFIRRNEVNPWNYMHGCDEIKIANHPDSIVAGLIPTTIAATSMNGAITHFFASTPECVDCTTRGTNIKPSFWP